MRWFRRSDTRAMAARIAALEAGNAALDERNTELYEHGEYLEKMLQGLQKSAKRDAVSSAAVATERDKLKRLVREQTEADLLVNALKAVGLISKPTVSRGDATTEAQRLENMRRQAQGSYPGLERGGASGQGLMQSLGMGSVLG